MSSGPMNGPGVGSPAQTWVGLALPRTCRLTGWSSAPRERSLWTLIAIGPGPRSWTVRNGVSPGRAARKAPTVQTDRTALEA